MNQDTSFICYGKTRHSNLVRSALSKGKAINVAANSFRLLTDFLKDSNDPAQARLVEDKWNHFLLFLELNDLTISQFLIAFDTDHYLLRYEMYSTRFNNPAFQVVRGFDSPVGFNFVPQAFVGWLDSLLDDVPFEQLLDVAAGN